MYDQLLVLCEYLKFRIVSNSYFSIRFNTYRHRFLTNLTEWCQFFTLATTPSNQQNLLLTMVQVLYLLEVFILAHYYGPPSTETPTTETTIVRCHKNSWIYLSSTYYWWLLRPTITIRFDSKFQIIAQLFDSIWNEKNTIRTALPIMWTCAVYKVKSKKFKSTSLSCYRFRTSQYQLTWVCKRHYSSIRMTAGDHNVCVR